MVQRIRTLLTQGRLSNRQQGGTFDGRLLEQMREDVFVTMHRIGPVR